MINLNILPLPEPLWSAELMRALNAWINTHELLVRIVPITADIFVFTYPVLLIALYLYGEYGPWMERLEYKLYSLYIASSAAGTVGVNALIQMIVAKDRPEEFIENKEFLILSHVPTDPFPSDHAGVSAGVAMAVTIRAYQTKKPLLIVLSVYLWAACLIMSFARVGVAIHRPMDVVAGILVGSLTALLIRYTKLWDLWKKYIALPLIDFQNIVFKKLHIDHTS